MKSLLYYRIIGRLCDIGTILDDIAPLEENAINFAHENINTEPNRMIDENHSSLEYCLAHSGEKY